MSATSELLQQKFRLHPIIRQSVIDLQESNKKKLKELEDLKAKLLQNNDLEEVVIVRLICKKIKELKALTEIVIDNDSK